MAKPLHYILPMKFVIDKIKLTNLNWQKKEDLIVLTSKNTMFWWLTSLMSVRDKLELAKNWGHRCHSCGHLHLQGRMEMVTKEALE